jgi:general secretion pathway protein L
MVSSFEQTNVYEFENQTFSEQNEELNNFLREKYFESMGFYVNIPVEEIILRELTLPFITKGKIKELLPFELESLLPYEISEIYYDYHIYPEPEKNLSKIIVCACKRSFLDPYVDFFFQNNFILKGFYIPIDALVQLGSLNRESPETILYMAASYSAVIVLNEGIWSYSRIFPVGYDLLFSGISKLWKKDFSESKKMLTEIPVSDSDIIDTDYYQSKFKLSKGKSKELVDVLVNFSLTVNREVKSTLLKSSGTKGNPKLSLVSDLDNQVFLENILTEKLSSEIVPYPYGNTPISLVGRNYVIPIGISYAISSNRFINLFVSDIKKRFKPQKGKSFSLVYFLLLAASLIFAGSFLLNGLQKKRQYDLVQERKIQLFMQFFKKAPDEETSMLSQAKQILEEQKKRSELYQLQANKYKLSQLLFELNQALSKSSDFVVERFAYSNNIISIVASTADFNQLNQIKSYLFENPAFQDTEIKDQRSFLAPGGNNRVRFSIVIKPKVEVN